MNLTAEATRKGIRPVFINCPRCEGVGFILFESMGFVLFEEPIGLIQAKCEICGGDGEIIYTNPASEVACENPESFQKNINEE
jgi:DnaJ-class molecular chaperone